MRLFFFRHGLAEPGTDRLPDHERALTAVGSERIERAVRVLKALDAVPAYLLTSPLVRARQTAEILAEGLGLTAQVRPELAPGFGLPALEALVADLNDGDIMLVGHEPDLSVTIGALTGGVVLMKKGGMARVDLVGYRPLRGALVWLLAPRVFDVLA